MNLLSPIAQKLRGFRHFSRRVWSLSAPYFRSEDKWKARGLLAAIVALNLGAVYMLVLLNEWNRVFYDALQNKDAAVFWTQLARFTYLAFAFIIIAVYRFYLTQLLEVRWRAWMTAHYLERWLSGQAFYQLELARFTGNGDASAGTPDNPDQRIQEDINLFTSYSISLSMGLLNAVVTLVSFVGILWSLSGAFAFSFNGASYSIPGFMVWMAVLYCVVGSVHHALHRPPADPAQLPAAAGRGRFSAPHGAGARIQRIHRAGQGRSRGARAARHALCRRAGQLPAS